MTNEEIDLIAAAKKRIEEVYQIAENFYGSRFVRPHVSFNIKGRIAGKAFPSTNEIRLNKTLLLENREAFIADTPGHEAAHLIAKTHFGSCTAPHGREWKEVMVAIGQEPSRCHNYEIKTGHPYFCNCRTHYVSTRRHNQALKGEVTLNCKHCKTKLAWQKLSF